MNRERGSYNQNPKQAGAHLLFERCSTPLIIDIDLVIKGKSSTLTNCLTAYMMLSLMYGYSASKMKVIKSEMVSENSDERRVKYLLQNYILHTYYFWFICHKNTSIPSSQSWLKSWKLNPLPPRQCQWQWWSLLWNSRVIFLKIWRIKFKVICWK